MLYHSCVLLTCAHMLELSTLAASSYSHVFTCRISARRTGRTDGRTDRTDGRTDRTDGRTGRTDRTDGQDGRTDGQDGQDGRIVDQKDNAKLDPKTQYLTLGPKF